jgi:hypothetical protein
VLPCGKCRLQSDHAPDLVISSTIDQTSPINCSRILHEIAESETSRLASIPGNVVAEFPRITLDTTSGTATVNAKIKQVHPRFALLIIYQRAGSVLAQSSGIRKTT